jgi:glucose/arabinose dehydrogenase
MRFFCAAFACILITCLCSAQPTFSRSELPTQLSNPWEMTYGPDGYLWITENGGKVSRVDPVSGAKTVVYTAPDYFAGSPLEANPVCTSFQIGKGTFGLALHPDFMLPSLSYIYYVYSYNSGTVQAPATKLKVVRLTWDVINNVASAPTDLITMMPIGYDHFGGRLLAVKQDQNSYLYLSIGDNGISETNAPNCYDPLESNPNYNAQDVNYKNGKIHRFNIDGTIPQDNPISGNSFWTRGHRNPQGLMYNPLQDVLYDAEHGDRTDDEVNVLYKGMNYGWKWVRGVHYDNNYPGEWDYINNYVPHAQILNDSLVQPLFSFCASPQPTDPEYLNWCTVAPSDGIYYGSNAIPSWQNSLLVVSLKDGTSNDQAVYQFKLNADGKSMATPGPYVFFANDHALNGRLRDIAVSSDGSKIYLINNGGTNADKITVYTYLYTDVNENDATAKTVKVFPNPGNGNYSLNINAQKTTKASIVVYDITGRVVLGDNVSLKAGENLLPLTLANATQGIYMVSITMDGVVYSQKVVVE